MCVVRLSETCSCLLLIKSLRCKREAAQPEVAAATKTRQLNRLGQLVEPRQKRGTEPSRAASKARWPGVRASACGQRTVAEGLVRRGAVLHRGGAAFERAHGRAQRRLLAVLQLERHDLVDQRLICGARFVVLQVPASRPHICSRRLRETRSCPAGTCARARYPPHRRQEC